MFRNLPVDASSPDAVDAIEPAARRCRAVNSRVLRSVVRLARVTGKDDAALARGLPMLAETLDVDLAAALDRHDGSGGNVIIRIDDNRVMKCIPVADIASKAASTTLLSPDVADIHGSMLSHHMGAAKLVSTATRLYGYVPIPPAPDSHDPTRYTGLIMLANDTSLAVVVRRAVQTQDFAVIQSLLLQVVAGVGAMQAAACLVHNDLCAKNVMCQSVDRSSVLTYRRHGDQHRRDWYRLPTHGWVAHIIDFSSCYMVTEAEAEAATEAEAEVEAEAEIRGSERTPVVSSAAAVDELLIARSRPYVAWRDVLDLASSVMYETLRSMTLEHRTLVSAYVKGDVPRANVLGALGAQAVALVDMLVRWATVTSAAGEQRCVFTQSAPAGGFATDRRIVDMMVSASLSRGILVLACTLAIREVVAQLTCAPFVGTCPQDVIAADWARHRLISALSDEEESAGCPLPLLSSRERVFPVPAILPHEQRTMTADVFDHLRRASDLT